MSQEPAASRTPRFWVWIQAKTHRLIIFFVLLIAAAVLIGEVVTQRRNSFISTVLLFGGGFIGALLGTLYKRRRDRIGKGR